MASFNLPYTLSAEDAALFKTIQDSALLPSLAQPGEGKMVELFKQNKKEEQKRIIAPYADLLEEQLMKMLLQRKAEILQTLKESKGTSFSVDLFSWKTINYHESLSQLKAREADMSREERIAHYRSQNAHAAAVKETGWESMFGVYEEGWNGREAETMETFAPVKVDRIFRNSDLAMRISLALGPNFLPFIAWENKDHSVSMGWLQGFNVFKKTLGVRYYPFGVPKQQMKELLAVAKSEAKRFAEGKKTRLGGGEYTVGDMALNIFPDEYADMPHLEDEFADMPPLIPATKERCFCGCDDSDSE